MNPASKTKHRRNRRNCHRYGHISGNSSRDYSQILQSFEVNNFKFQHRTPRRILLFPKGNNNKGADLSIYLEAVKTANMSEGWSRDVKIKFNQLEIVTHGFEEKVYHLTVKECFYLKCTIPNCANHEEPCNNFNLE
ncbi:hypothetical protein P8452_55441 [Trifolium repens]|nr:hypothetical protein P8452_55441 [Trifolium repens]